MESAILDIASLKEHLREILTGNSDVQAFIRRVEVIFRDRYHWGKTARAAGFTYGGDYPPVFRNAKRVIVRFAVSPQEIVP
jgi:hypothetical protein